MDCANGAASQVGPQALREAGADVVVFNASPDGRNINLDCGSTHPEALMSLVRERELALGVAFDGDGDRCLLVDHTGALVDGDQVIVLGLQKVKPGAEVKAEAAADTAPTAPAKS